MSKRLYQEDLPLNEEMESNNDLFISNNVDRLNNTINELQEDEIKLILANHLIANGCDTKLGMGKVRGIDIDASKGNGWCIIEVKGCCSIYKKRGYKLRLNYRTNLII